jgi:hypothetical protein
VPPSAWLGRDLLVLYPYHLELVRTAAFLVWAVARESCDLPRIFAVSRAVLLAVCAYTGAGGMGALLGLACHMNLRTTGFSRVRRECYGQPMPERALTLHL